jgi:hypothetical protein
MSENINLDINEKCCSNCDKTKKVDEFLKNRTICKDCNNEMRRQKYNNNEEYRKKVIQKSSSFKTEKAKVKREVQKQNQIDIGENNKICKTCEEILPNTNFRTNRLKCKDCEKKCGREYRQSEIGKDKSNIWLENNREKMKELQANWFQNNKSYVQEKNNKRIATDPRYKFIVNQRRRISLAIKNKQKKTIDYLGCNSEEYLRWIMSQFNGIFTLENHGKEWHIDHVIPISNFNLENEDEQLIAFNWRNTMPLSVTENLSKNNKIIKSQIEQHLQQLLKYHTENNIEMPKKFIELYAKHLDDGKPPKVITTTPYMETLKGDLG